MSFQFYVQVVERGSDPEEIVANMGPMALSKAGKVQDGVDITINRLDYFTRIVSEEGGTYEDKE